MLKIEDLRIGNYFTNATGEIHRVLELHADGIVIGLFPPAPYAEESQDPVYHTYDGAEGILLTINQLAGFGFNPTRMPGSRYDTWFFQEGQLAGLTTTSAGIMFNALNREIETVHDLQNLFKAVTGRDLAFPANIGPNA